MKENNKSISKAQSAHNRNQMLFSFADIETIAECETMIEIANEERTHLNLRKHQLDVQLDTMNKKFAAMAKDLLNINKELDLMQNYIDNLLDVNTKDNFKIDRSRLEYKKYLLLENKTKLVMTGIQKAYVLDLINKNLADNQKFIDKLMARKKEM